MTDIHQTQRLILRTLTADEAVLAQAYYTANKAFLQPYEPSRDDSFYTLDHQKRLLELEVKEMDQRHMLRLWIFLKDASTTRPIGNIGFTNIVRGVFLSCFVGYKLDSEYIQQGYMSEALEKAIDIMFTDYGLHRIEANIMPINKASLALTEKLGFNNEGIGRKYLRINNQWEDHIHMVKFNESME